MVNAQHNLKKMFSQPVDRSWIRCSSAGSANNPTSQECVAQAPSAHYLPDVLKFMDIIKSDTVVYIMTECPTAIDRVTDMGVQSIKNIKIGCSCQWKLSGIGLSSNPKDDNPVLYVDSWTCECNSSQSQVSTDPAIEYWFPQAAPLDTS
ncbi:hypothetical protein V8E55_010508 [Tylopilus felleus]